MTGNLRSGLMVACFLAVSGCTYMVAESLDNCRVESEKFLGYTLWEDWDCTTDKDDDSGPIVRKLKKGKTDGNN